LFIRNYDVWIYALLLVAAIVGGAVNYSIGKWTGLKVFHYESSRLFNKDHLLKAHAFYENTAAARSSSPDLSRSSAPSPPSSPASAR